MRFVDLQVELGENTRGNLSGFPRVVWDSGYTDNVPVAIADNLPRNLGFETVSRDPADSTTSVFSFHYAPSLISMGIRTLCFPQKEGVHHRVLCQIVSTEDSVMNLP